MNPPKGYHKIKVHLVFAVKFDGIHQARLVADAHLTPEPIDVDFFPMKPNCVPGA